MKQRADENNIGKELPNLAEVPQNIKLGKTTSSEIAEDFGRLPEPIDTYSVSEKSPLAAGGALAKKYAYRNLMKKTHKKEYFLKNWQKHLSPERAQACLEFLENENVLIVVDNEMIEFQSKALGAAYGAGSYGSVCVFRSREDVENRRDLVRHEVTHSKQVQDLGGGIIGLAKWTLMSQKSMSEIKSKYKDLVPWAADFATDNQITDQETYLHQNDPTYFAKRVPKDFLKRTSQAIRNQLAREYMQSNINKLEKEIEKMDHRDKKGLDKAHERLNQMIDLMASHDQENRYQMATFFGKDKFAYKPTPEDHQLFLISETALRREVGLDTFITHYEPEKNYKAGTDLYQKYTQDIKPIIETYVKEGDEKQLYKDMQEIFRMIEQKEKL